MPFFTLSKLINTYVSLQVQQSAKKNQKNEIFNKERKRVYLFTSEGSITIEASIVIYIFLAVVLFVEGYLMFLNTEFSMQQKINNVAIEVSKNMFYLDAIKDATDNSKDIKEIKDEIVNYLGNDKEYVEKGIEKTYLTARLIQEIDINNMNSFLCGVAGINTTESSIENGQVDLVATYKMQVPLLEQYITFTQRSKVKSWTGVDLREKSEMVYITKRGKVYHTSTNCPSLSITINKTTYEECKSKYNKCRICVNNKSNLDGSIFVTEDGDRFHSDLKCKGLVRNIITISKKEICDLPKCSKCRKKK